MQNNGTLGRFILRYDFQVLVCQAVPERKCLQKTTFRPSSCMYCACHGSSSYSLFLKAWKIRLWIRLAWAVYQGIMAEGIDVIDNRVVGSSSQCRSEGYVLKLSLQRVFMVSQMVVFRSDSDIGSQGGEGDFFIDVHCGLDGGGPSMIRTPIVIRSSDFKGVDKNRPPGKDGCLISRVESCWRD